VTSDAASLIGESPEVRGFWLCEAVWVKDGPGAARLCAEWMVKGTTPVDVHSADIARFYPAQKDREYVRGRCYENAQTVYYPPVHPREPYLSGRDLFHNPFYERETELGGTTKLAVGSAPTRTLRTRKNSPGIWPKFRHGKTSGTVAMFPTRQLTPSISP